MGNSRGNSNSRKHVSLDPKKEEYWKFSSVEKSIYLFISKILNNNLHFDTCVRWDEMGRYDIPACIDYVLDVTEQEKLAAYIGYSLGCTLFFIGAINKPRMNEQVDMMIGLGATSSIAHLDNFYYYLGLVVKPYHVMHFFS